jgi:predicted membrane channel-forming protein YqfA (hemolysin III family)
MSWKTGVQFLVGTIMGIFLFATASRQALELTQLPIQWVLGALSPGVKWLWCEVDHLPPSGPNIKNEWSYTSIPQYMFMAWCLVKHRTTLHLPFMFFTKIIGVAQVKEDEMCVAVTYFVQSCLKLYMLPLSVLLP